MTLSDYTSASTSKRFPENPHPMFLEPSPGISVPMSLVGLQERALEREIISKQPSSSPRAPRRSSEGFTARLSTTIGIALQIVEHSSIDPGNEQERA